MLRCRHLLSPSAKPDKHLQDVLHSGIRKQLKSTVVGDALHIRAAGDTCPLELSHAGIRPTKPSNTYMAAS